MMHLKTWFGVMALVCVVAVGASDQARADQILTFDDLSLGGLSGLDALTGLPVPAGYGGLTWTNFNHLDTAAYASIPSGYTQRNHRSAGRIDRLLPP